MRQRSALSLFLPAGILALAWGCGGGSATQPAPPAAPRITSQPQSQAANPGDRVTFSVTVDGTSPWTAQWYWNGMPIENATQTIYTLDAAVPADHLSAFTVTVANAQGAVTSQPALLSINGAPRPPKAGDLRFHDVDAFPPGVQWAVNTNINARISYTFTNGVGSLLSIGWPGPATPTGTQDVNWFFDAGPLPQGAPGRTTKFSTGILSAFASDAAAMVGPDTVFASLDFDEGENAYAVELVTTTAGNGGYTTDYGTVELSALPALAAQEGAQGRVITALAYSGGHYAFFAHGWQGDASTVYETQVSQATVATLVSEAAALAQAGYIITGVGGSDKAGFVLVGTRVQGDTTPRALNQPLPAPYARGYATVAYVYLADPGDPANGKEIHISEM